MGQRRRRRDDPARGARLLLVESDPAELDRLSGLLRAAGCRVAALSRPDAALALTRAFRPDAAIIGLGGPHLDGVRTGKRLDRRYRGAVPVLYLAEAASDGMRRHCFGEGAAISVLPRSATNDELLATLRAVLAFRNAVEARVRREFDERPPELHDEGTGLYNRSFLMEMVATELRRSERYGGCFTLGIVELDRFVSWRDELGEGLCERLMVQASGVLRQSVRDSDLVARVGRYHFGLLLPGMPIEGVGSVTERIERRFGDARFEVAGRVVHPTVTAGLATFPDVLGPAEQMFVRAIQELDRAREEKRIRRPPRAAV